MLPEVHLRGWCPMRWWECTIILQRVPTGRLVRRGGHRGCFLSRCAGLLLPRLLDDFGGVTLPHWVFLHRRSCRARDLWTRVRVRRLARPRGL